MKIIYKFKVYCYNQIFIIRDKKLYKNKIK